MHKTTLFLCVMLFSSITAYTQGMKVEKTLLIYHPVLKSNAKPEAFQSVVDNDVIPALAAKNPGTTYSLFRADRGKQKGEFLLVASANNASVNPKKNPFDVKGLQDATTNTGSFTQYQLIGADKVKALPTTGILGIHSIQVKKEKAKDFEKLVVEKLHPAVSHLFPDMQLLYYKAVAGEHTGSYITIFTIDSPAARDNYWPGGSAETEILKTTFKGLEGLAKELGTYLVDGSYLEPSSGGAAAYWESKVWTDFIHSSYMQ